MSELDKLIEECIRVFGTKAFHGQYAAPREAFRDILKQAYSLALADAKKCVPEKEAGIANMLNINTAKKYGFNQCVDQTLENIKKLDI